MPKVIESEKKLEKQLKETVEKKMDGICVKLTAEFSNGIPDRVCLLPKGKTFFVEVKTTGKKPRPLQLWWHERLRALGFQVYILDKHEQLDTIIAENKDD